MYMEFYLLFILITFHLCLKHFALPHHKFTEFFNHTYIVTCEDQIQLNYGMEFLVVRNSYLMWPIGSNFNNVTLFSLLLTFL